MCDVEGSPPPRITWLYIDEYGDPSTLSNVRVEPTPTGQNLVIDNLNYSGTFTCKARNSFGVDSVIFGVNVV